jgi:V-type H+-transporting ATPase subunit A
LAETIQSIGHDQLKESEKLTLDIAQIIREDFLQQNVFNKYDMFCPMYKTRWMMNNIVTYYTLALELLENGRSNKINWNFLKTETKEEFDSLSTMKFEV